MLAPTAGVVPRKVDLVDRINQSQDKNYRYRHKKDGVVQVLGTSFSIQGSSITNNSSATNWTSRATTTEVGATQSNDDSSAATMTGLEKVCRYCGKRRIDWSDEVKHLFCAFCGQRFPLL